MSLIRYFTLGSTAYPKIVIKEQRAGTVPAVLFRSLNKKGKIENFKGDPFKTFKEFYSNPKFPAVFAVGLWRDNHDFKREDDLYVVDIAKQLNLRHNGKPIYFMPFLEHTQSASFMSSTFQRINLAAPNLLPVNNPANFNGKSGEYVKGMFNELHYGAKPRGERPPLKDLIVCFDGHSAFDADYESWRNEFYGKVHIFSNWIAAFNQRLNTNDTTARPQRKHKPQPKDFRQLEWYQDNVKGVTKLQKKELKKSNADRHYPGKKDPRADTPLYILSVKGKQILEKTKNGKKITTYNYDKPYKGGGYIYRPVSYKKRGYEYAKIAIQLSGSAICDVFLDDKKIGEVNLAYRDGYYR